MESLLTVFSYNDIHTKNAFIIGHISNYQAIYAYLIYVIPPFWWKKFTMNCVGAGVRHYIDKPNFGIFYWIFIEGGR